MIPWDSDVIDGKVPRDTVKECKNYLIAKDTDIYLKAGNHANETTQQLPDSGASLPDPQVSHEDFGC